MKHLTTFSLSFIFFIISQICSGQEGCIDPEAWNAMDFPISDSTKCIYLEDCEDGTINRMFNLFFNGYAADALIYITSIDGVDTLAQHQFLFQSVYTSPFSNLMLTCMEEGTCYYMDIYLTDTFPSTPGSIERYIPESQIWVGHFFLTPGSSDFYRTLISSEQNTCGILGCTDPFALNYWPSATINYNCQYCEENELVLSADYVLNNNSMYWQIQQDGEYITGGIFGGSPGDDDYELQCLPDGCYDLVLNGDAWLFSNIVLEHNGDTLVRASLTQDGEVKVPFALNTEPCDSGEIYGCTNPLGQNYNPEVTIDNGSCDLQNENCNLGIVVYQDSLTQEVHFDVDIYSTDYPIDIFWDFGDGSPISNEWWGEHMYDSAGVYVVCATLYSQQFFEQTPLCYDQTCITLNTDEFGITGGFPIYLDNESDGLNAISKTGELRLSPNPVDDKLWCTLPRNRILKEVKIYSIDGRLIKNFANLQSVEKAVQIDVSTLTNGTYLIFAQDSHKAFFTARFVKL